MKALTLIAPNSYNPYEAHYSAWASPTARKAQSVLHHVASIRIGGGVLLCLPAFTECFNINEVWEHVVKLEQPNNTIQEAWQEVLKLEELNKTFHKEIDAKPGSDLFLLYTRRNPILGQIIKYGDVASVTSSNFNPNVSTVVVVHGWLEDRDSPINPILRSALLWRSDVNVIVMDWSRFSQMDYITAVIGVPSVGRGLGQFLAFLKQASGMSYDMLHLVGFSLGGHVVGNAGRELDGQVTRITALDPAGPLWYTNEHRLRNTDARYVEAIHTNAGGLGILMSVGDTDFFPNGGTTQPGCYSSNYYNILCNHGRSVLLFASSVNTRHLVGRQCSSTVTFVADFCRGKSLPLGNDNLNKSGTGVYRLNTRAIFPY